MKLKTAAVILAGLAWAGFACAGTNDITTLVQKGLFEEEASHHLDAAEEYYQEAIGNFDKDRQLTATAIFHLGECYRLQGRTNEANVQYQRIVREFPDQAGVVELSRDHLPKADGGAVLTTGRSVFTQNLARIAEQSFPEKDEIRRIQDMIQNSPDLINAPSPGSSQTPLNIAAGHGWMAAAKLLLENGAVINPQAPRGMTPLTEAADAGNKGMIEFLLSRGADANARDGFRGFAALHYAVEHGFKTMAEGLLNHGADVNVPAGDGDRPLHLAVKQGYLSIAELLLANKAGVDASGKAGETALFRAIQFDRIEMVQFLISHKAGVNIQSDSGETPLLCAVGRHDSSAAIVKELLDSGADATASARTRHPLDLCVKEGRADLVELFLQKNADPNAAARWNVLVQQNPAMGTYVDRTIAPLILAIDENTDNQSKIAALLLRRGADPNAADEYGVSALDYAISRVNTNIMADLILHHADVNAPDKAGTPPLVYAARFESYAPQNGQMRQMLLQAGANEDYQRRGAIFITRKGTGLIGRQVFSKATNSVNRYTLFDLIATAYGPQTGPPYAYRLQVGQDAANVSFPDFAHLAINRLKDDGSKEEIAVDLNEMLQSGDCSQNPWLEWGDVVLIPQLDHKVNEGWGGISPTARETLGKCLLRTVKLIVKRQTTEITLLPHITRGYAEAHILSDGNVIAETPVPQPPLSPPPAPALVPGGVLRLSPPKPAGTLPGKNIMYGFGLDHVVLDANVLLISSDLRRVRVTRRESKTGQPPRVMVFDLETQPRPDVQLVDGDVIEIPERGQGIGPAN